MNNPLIIHPDETVILPPFLFPNANYYRCLAGYRRAVIDTSMRYDKRRKDVHRYTIADTRGPLQLTVPVSRPSGAFASGKLRWNEVTVSAHGRWWEVHRTAWESAYGRTPFFEFYIDRFAPVFCAEGQPITDLVLRAHGIVSDILGLETEILTELPGDCTPIDMTKQLPETDERPYWQVRGQQLGFIPGLSILDLIFNLGPEAPLALQCR